MPRVCPGTSVILAAIVRLPNRAIQSLGQAEPEPEQGRVHVLAEQAERQGMPGNVAPASIAASIRLPTGAVGPLEVLVDQPRARRPDEPVAGWSVERPAVPGPAARICSLREIALGMNSSMYRATMVDAKSLNPMSRWVLNTTWTRSTASLTARLLIGGEKRRADPPPFRPSVTCRRSADPIVLTYPTSALGAIRCRSGRPYATVWEATLGRGLGGPGADAIRLLVTETPHWSDEPCSNLASPNGQCQGKAREVDRHPFAFYARSPRSRR